MFITYQAQLLEKKQIAPDVFLFTFSCPPDEVWTFKAGQYMIFHIPQKEGHAARRLYSIASPPSQKNTLDFVIEMVPNGIGSMFLSALELGGTITLQGPAGMFAIRSDEKNKIFLATGTGIAPMHSMIHTLIEENTTKELHVFWGLKKCEDMYYGEELMKLATRYPNLKLYWCFSREASMETIKQELQKNTVLGRVTVGFEALMQEIQMKTQQTSPELLNSFEYYVCGGQVVVENLRQYLAEKGVTKENVIFEKFTAGV